jgi:hypothetical protein
MNGEERLVDGFLVRVIYQAKPGSDAPHIDMPERIILAKPEITPDDEKTWRIFEEVNHPDALGGSAWMDVDHAKYLRHTKRMPDISANRNTLVKNCIVSLIGAPCDKRIIRMLLDILNSY